MKNILFISPYKSQSGWGHAGHEYLEALLLTDNNVVARPAYMSNEPLLPPSKSIEEAENKRLDRYPDVVIQNLLPDLFERYDCYNIGLIHTETRNCNPLWVNKINLMDELWVNSELEKTSLIDDGVKCKVSVMPIPIDIKKLERYHKFVKPLNIPEFNEKFIFYFIGEHNERKNIMAFIQAFHREFAYHEAVSLLIKTNSEALKNDVNEWKKLSRTRAIYIPEAFMVGNIPEETIYSIHDGCDCFVCTSRGESNCLPIGDALYFNNSVICPDNIFASSVYDYITKVESQLIPVNCKQPPINHIYTGQESWADIDIIKLQKTLRLIFEQKSQNDSRQYIKDNFSRERISEKMNDIL